MRVSDAAWAAHRARVEALTAALVGSSGAVRLKKSTSNLFRPRQEIERTELDVTDLDHIIGIDTDARVAEVEGMTT